MKLCECGCGLPTNTAPQPIKRLGIARGEHFPFVRGHHAPKHPFARELKHFPPLTDIGCWEWQGRRNENGYGIVCVTSGYKLNRLARMHRVMWEAANGPIPTGMMVCHKCDNPPCFRLDHLFLGTNNDNQMDKVAKGRQHHPPKGCPAHLKPITKLTAEQVSEIKTICMAGASRRSAAKMFHVSPSNVDKIMNGETWRDVNAN